MLTWGNENKDIFKRELETGFWTYRTLAEQLQMVICNNMQERLYNQLELESGNLTTYFDSETHEELTEEQVIEYDELEKDYYEQDADIFQFFIVNDTYWLEQANELIFYDNELDVYVWGVTHFGTSWDYVFTNIEVSKGGV